MELPAKVFMCVSAGKTPASGPFFDCFYNTILPEGSMRQRTVGSNVFANMNVLIKDALAGGFTHIFYVDDDWLFQPDIVLRLLAHDKDCVAPLVTQRGPAFRPCMFDKVAENGMLGMRDIQPGEKGLIKVLGPGGLPSLTKLSIFKQLEEPYYPYNWIDPKTGIGWDGDILFAKKLIEANIDIYVDLDIPIWHQGNYAVAAVRDNEGNWITRIRIGSSNIDVPLFNSKDATRLNESQGLK